MIFPSGVYSFPKQAAIGIEEFDPSYVPKVGDIIIGQVKYIAQHATLENKKGRIHNLYDGMNAVFVFGNRYAPDYYEGFAELNPDDPKTVDLLARSGVVGRVCYKNKAIKDPTKIEIIGYVKDKHGIANTLDYNLIIPNNATVKTPRSKLILVVGTAMNSGKSVAASAICWGLNYLGYTVKASKLLGTASLKDILRMNDAGAKQITDFTHLGHPSTYMCSEEQLKDIFNLTDLKIANNKKNYWVVELADGLLQRETSMMLKMPEVLSRIHKLVLCGADAHGIIGGLKILENNDLEANAISGVITSSPLAMRELIGIDLPIIDSININTEIINNLV